MSAQPILSIMLLLGFTVLREATGQPLYTAMFVFGDSLSDPGNNNYFTHTSAKAAYSPYGIDFERGPTGRFSNGKILVDFIAELLGLQFLPSYANTVAENDNILMGVNYASAGAGILEETGKAIGQVIPFSGQIDNFRKTLNQLRYQMQDNELSNYLAKALAFVDIGSNDYLNNYLQPWNYRSSRVYTPQQYAALLIKLYADYILNLRNLGFRKFFLVNLPPPGCSPIVKELRRGALPGQCEPTTNNLVLMFNAQLNSLVNQLNSDYPDSVFTSCDSFKLFLNLRNNADVYGIRVKDKACCSSGRYGGGKVLCLRNSNPCPNRGQYLFWDEAHLTEAANSVLALGVYNNSAYAFPVTLEQMARR